MIKGPLVTARRKVERFAVARLLSLPESMKLALANRLSPPQAVPLDADVRLLLAVAERRPNFIQEDVAVSRRIYADTLALLDRAREPVAWVKDHQVPVKDGRVLVREYV